MFALFISVLMVNSVSAVEDDVRNEFILSLPQLDWALSMGNWNMFVKEKGVSPDGKSAYFAGTGIDGEMISGFLEERPEAGTAKECRDFYWDGYRRGNDFGFS